MATSDYKTGRTQRASSICRPSQIHVAPVISESDNTATLGRQTTELRSLKVICALLAVSIVLVAATFGIFTYSLMEKIDNTERTVGQLESTMNAVLLRLKTVESEIPTLDTNQTTDTNQTETPPDITALRSRVETLEIDLGAYRTDALNDKDFVTALVQNQSLKIQQVESDQSADRSSVQLLSTVVTQLDADLASKCSLIEKHSKDIEANNNSLKQLQDDIIVQAASIQVATDRLDQIEINITDDRTNILLHEARIMQLEASLTVLNASLNAQQLTIEEIEAREMVDRDILSNHTSKLIQLEKKLNETDSMIQSDNTAQNTMIQTLTDRLDELELNVTEVISNIFLQETRIMQVEASLTQQNVSLKTQITKIDELESQGAITEYTLSNHTARLLTLTTNINEMDADLQCANSINQAQTAEMLELLPGSCQNGFVPYGASCYMFSSDKVDWTAAHTACGYLGGHLAEITDTCESNFVKSIALEMGGDFWLGGSDQIEEGDWRWVHSQTAISNHTFSDWGPGIPDNFGGNENYLSLANRHKVDRLYWEDINHASLHSYICEMERWT